MPKKPTIKQKRAADLAIQAVASGQAPGDDITWKSILTEAGYSKSVAERPQTITESEGFKQVINKVDDNVIIDRLYEILTDKEGKRESLKAADMLLKLKDRYPAGKVKVGSFQEQLGEIIIEQDTVVEDEDEPDYVGQQEDN